MIILNEEIDHEPTYGLARAVAPRWARGPAASTCDWVDSLTQETTWAHEREDHIRIDVPARPSRWYTSDMKRQPPPSKGKLLALLAALVVLSGIIAVGAITESDEPSAATESSTGTADSGEAVIGSAEESEDPELEETLTAENNTDLAAVLKSTGDPEVLSDFATKHEGRQIQFDGVIVAMAPHENYDTRFNILIIPGDDEATETNSASFQFRDENITSDLNLTGPNVPEVLGVGDKLRVTATVDEYLSDLDLLVLEPVTTEVR